MSATGAFYHRAKCEVCGETAERIVTFTADTTAQMYADANAWQRGPLRHKKCEPPPT